MVSSQKKKKSGSKRTLWTWVMTMPLLAVAVAIFMMGQQDDQPTIGGPFVMTMGDGREVTEKFLEKAPTFVFFGYTACPDICPTSLATLAAALDALPEDKQKATQTLFVSVDPERDFGPDLDEYVKMFHETFHGVTGTRKQIDDMVAAYRAYYKIDKSIDPENYPVDHTAIMYLMDTKGRYLSHFSSNAPPEKITKKLMEIL